MPAEDGAYAAKATRIAALARDVTEVVEDRLGLSCAEPIPAGITAKHRGRLSTPPARCSTANASTWGQRRSLPRPASTRSTCRKGISAAARPAPTTYLQPQIASQHLRDPQKARQHSRDPGPISVATGNIGIIQLAATVCDGAGRAHGSNSSTGPPEGPHPKV